MKSDKVALTCDLCGAKAVADSLAASRWMELSFEDKQLDRSWHEKHLCVSCVNQIAIKLKAEARP